MPLERSGKPAESAAERRTIAVLVGDLGDDEPSGAPLPDLPGEVIGIPDGSFGEEYGGMARPERGGGDGGGENGGPRGGGGERVARNTAIVSLATGLSRAPGLAREIVAAKLLRDIRSGRRPLRSPFRSLTW